MLIKITPFRQISFFFFLASVSLLQAQSVEIWQLQGSSGISPYQFQSVNTTQNIVTAVGADFFFMQTPAERSDNNTLTSDGILVITEGPHGLSPGRLVNVYGTISELEGMTTLYADEVQMLAGQAPLPSPVAFDASFPSPIPSPLSSLERVEGMRVSTQEALVCGPSDYYEEAALSATPTLPQRGPGIRYPGQNNLPVWDGNPEIFWFDPDALNNPNNRFLSVGMRVSATGVLAQWYGRYTLWPTQYSTSGAIEISPARALETAEFSLASFNVLQLRTDEDGYAQHVQKVARYIVEALRTPDILALQEVGSLTALQDLNYYIGLLSPGLGYSAHFRVGSDDINVAYLVRSRIQNVSITQLGNNEFLSIGGRLHDRPPLLLEATLPTSPPTPIAVLNLHLRSLLGLEGAEADFVRTKRHEQAVSVAAMVQARQSQNLFIVGDFNAYPFTDGYVDVLSQISGRSSLGALVPPQPLVSPTLVDYAETLPPTDRYSYIFDASTQQIDHCLSTQLSHLSASEFRFVRGNAGAALAYSPNPQIIPRTSDHDGFVLYLQPDFPVTTQPAPAAANPWLVAPNPFPRTGGTLYFQENHEGARLCLLDANARQLAQTQVQAQQSSWQPNLHLPPGLYLLQIQTEQGVQYERLLVH